MKRRPFAAAALGATVLVSGCGAGWQRVPVGESAQLPPRQQIQVFHGREIEQWYGVRLSLDTISGVPFFTSPSCDSCRLALPRMEVDSIRLGDPTGAAARSFGLGYLIMLLLAAWTCWEIGCGTST